MVGQILFGEGHELDGDQPVVGDGFDLVDQVKFHASLPQKPAFAL
jgi:hypothetical protein